MKIVQAVGWYYPETGGGTEVYVAGLARRLRARGHDVRIVAPDPGGRDERRYEHEGTSVYRFPTPDRLTRDEAQTATVVRGAGRLHAWLRAERPDVVHFHTLVPGLDVHEVAAARATGARIIATTHSSGLGHVCARGTMMRWGEYLCDGVTEAWKCAACDLQNRGLPKALASLVAAVPPSVGRIAGRIPGKAGTALGRSASIAGMRVLQASLLDQVDRYVLLTEWALEAMVRNGAPRGKLALNRLGTSHAGVVAKPGPEARATRRPVRVGYLGRFDPIKGVRVLAQALSALPADVPIALELRGPVQGPADLRVRDELQRMLAGDPRVRFAPAVPFDEVPDCLAGYDLLCCPSVCLEGGPTVAIEAYAAGTPVLGSRIGGLAELVTDGVNGRLVPPGDWRALAAALTAVAGDPAATIDRWRESLPRARTMDEVAADYLALYAA